MLDNNENSSILISIYKAQVTMNKYRNKAVKSVAMQQTHTFVITFVLKYQ